jgi:hypothetical protein
MDLIEVKEVKAEGKQPVLTGSRWLLLMHPGNMTDRQFTGLGGLVRLNLRSVKAYHERRPAAFLGLHLAALGR